MLTSSESRSVGIVIPLKARVASRNWGSTCSRLADTLASLRNQSSTAFHAAVVGHDQPEAMEWDDQISFYEIDVPAPTLHTAEDFATDNRRFTLDKNRKIVRGMQILASNDVDYWFTLDADDLVERRFVEYVTGTSTESGMLLEAGFLVYMPQRRYTRSNEMVRLCGSTSILCNANIRIPDSLDEIDIEKVPWCRYSHIKIGDYFEKELEASPVPVSEPLIAYVLGHGDNCSDGYRVNWIAMAKARMKPWFTAKRMDKHLQSRFGL